MSRFNLSKGERFSFAKDEGLNNLTVTIRKKPPCQELAVF